MIPEGKGFDTAFPFYYLEGEKHYGTQENIRQTLHARGT